MLYSYQKATPSQPAPGKIIPPYLRLMPIVVSAIGLGLVASVVWPLVSYQAANLLHFGKDDSGLLSPVYYESMASDLTNAPVTPVVVGDSDFTRASNWFTFTPDALSATAAAKPNEVYQYSLSIPALGINEASVRADTDDLSQNLIQYQGTAFPGEFGSPVIFGHSTLPQFFNPKNYLTVFATLPTISLGSDVLINYNGVTYTYRIRNMYEVKPTDVWVLRQDYSKKTLKLITCVPPGTKLRRLVIESDLITN